MRLRTQSVAAPQHRTCSSFFPALTLQADLAADPSLKSKPNLLVDDNLGFAKVLTRTGPLGVRPPRASEPGVQSCSRLTEPAPVAVATQDRTISRLLEMQTLEHLVAHARQHAPNNLLALLVRRAPGAGPPDQAQLGRRGTHWCLVGACAQEAQAKAAKQQRPH